MKLIKQITIGIFLIQSIACTSNRGNQDSSAVGAKDVPKHYTTDLYAEDGTVIGRLNQDMKEAEEQYKNRKGAQETTLFTVPGMAEFNTQVFRLNGLSEVRGVYAAPKLMVLSNENRSLFERNNDGTTTIPLMLAVVDGIQDQIPDPTTQDHVRAVPNIFRIKKQNGELGIDELKAKIKNMYGDSAELDSLPGCPATISISDGYNSYDVTPTEFKTSDYCQMNSPFVVSLRLPNEIAADWMTKILPAGYLTAYMRYQVEAPSVIGRISVHFNRRKFFQQIKANLNGNYKGILQTDVQMSIQKVIEANRANISVVGNVDELKTKIIEKAINEFFTPFKATPDLPAPAACQALACLQINYSEDSQNLEFSINYEETAAVRIPQFIESHTSLAPAGMKTKNIGQDPARNDESQALVNDGAIYHSGLSAVRGSILKFTLKNLQREQRSRSEEFMYTRSEGRTCIDHERGVPPFGPGPCKSWLDYHTYGYTKEFSPAIWERLLNPMQSTLDIMNELSIVITSKSGKASKCTLSSLMTAMNGESIELLIDNSQYCKIDTSNGENDFQVSFINQIAFPLQKYTKGQRVDSVNQGIESINTYELAEYYPKVKIFAEVSVQSGIMSTDAISKTTFGK